MKKYSILLLLLFILSSVSYSQNKGAYLIPRQIYVGDPAVLILPLDSTAQDNADIVLTAYSHNSAAESIFQPDVNIDIHRIILERRTVGNRLMIEFTAFVPGLIELPAIEIGEEYFTGLTVTVNSIIDNRSSPVLSGPASSLAMPGTALLLYGSTAVFIFLLLLTIWFILKGRHILRELKTKWKHYRLFASMKKMEKRLQRAVSKGGNKRIILDKLSEEFRIFLSFLTGNNCRAMTAREFEKLPPDFLTAQGFNQLFLGNFFHTCDELRFSGVNARSQDILHLLADLRQFIDALEKSRKEKNSRREEKAA
jgi:hypothetical protein